MQTWLAEEGCDGFMVMFSFLPEELEAFAAQVVPELQKRGLFRTEHEGETLREHFGLPRPQTATSLRADTRNTGPRPRSHCGTSVAPGGHRCVDARPARTALGEARREGP